MTSRVWKEIEQWDCRSFSFTSFEFSSLENPYHPYVTESGYILASLNLRVLMMFDQSLPVAFGFETAKWICVGAIDITQLSVAGIAVDIIHALYIKSPTRLELCQRLHHCALLISKRTSIFLKFS